MVRLDSPIPSISISPAPPKEPSPIEPQRSPYALTLLAPAGNDSPRPQHLLPPPSPHHRSAKKQVAWTGHGIDMAVFQALLQGAKSKKADVKAVTEPKDVQQMTLQRQVKQLERRARFLAKLAESPKASAVNTPVTPPESPAVFHFSLPSPGLESPCEVFDHQRNKAREVTRVEQVHFPTKPAGKGFLPSLEIISERMIRRTPSPPPIEESRQSDSRTAAAMALYDALNRRRATTNPPGISSQKATCNNIGISKAIEWRMGRQMAARGAELTYRRPHVVLC